MEGLGVAVLMREKDDASRIVDYGILPMKYVCAQDPNDFFDFRFCQPSNNVS